MYNSIIKRCNKENDIIFKNKEHETERGKFVSERKLLSACITSFAAFFILPLLYNNYQDGFLTAAFTMSAFAFPAIFTYGLVVSYISDFIAARKKNSFGFSFLFHAFSGAASAVLVLIYSWFIEGQETIIQPELLTGGFILGVIFFMVDLVLKNYGEYLNLKNS